LRAECEFALGCPEPGLAAAREAAAILRSPELWKSDRGRAVSELFALGMALWESGQSDGIRIISEAVARLEGNETRPLAARCRISLAAMLYHARRLVEAEAAMPDAADLPANKLPVLCTVQARIRLAQHRFEDAINDFEHSIQLRSEACRPNQIDLAINKSGLAMALFGCGRPAEAERQAQESLEILLPAQHTDAYEPLVTLALIGWQRGESGASERFEQGLRCLADARLIKPALKARCLEEEAQRLRENDRATEASRAEEAASAQWQLAGLEINAYSAFRKVHPIARETVGSSQSPNVER
jgi:tetratricopeptide (TPR) repeat protein